jgi:hypothetical protein
MIIIPKAKTGSIHENGASRSPDGSLCFSDLRSFHVRMLDIGSIKINDTCKSSIYYNTWPPDTRNLKQPETA